jgi:hypothetical protein
MGLRLFVVVHAAPVNKKSRGYRFGRAFGHLQLLTQVQMHLVVLALQEVRPCVATQESPADGMAQRRSVTEGAEPMKVVLSRRQDQIVVLAAGQAQRSTVAAELGAQDLLLRQPRLS